MSFHRSILSILLLSTSSILLAVYTDIILQNALMYKFDSDQSWAEGIAIKNASISFSGSDWTFI